mmetsp:Transcript_4764/g.14351  ORF Transcript_4764/g.14351 Transcript_4764/m.14351 type:complete len:242 (-) Transcript_4764:895-1620(-)
MHGADHRGERSPHRLGDGQGRLADLRFDGAHLPRHFRDRAGAEAGHIQAEGVFRFRQFGLALEPLRFLHRLPGRDGFYHGVAGGRGHPRELRHRLSHLPHAAHLENIQDIQGAEGALQIGVRLRPRGDRHVLGCFLDGVRTVHLRHRAGEDGRPARDQRAGGGGVLPRSGGRAAPPEVPLGRPGDAHVVRHGCLPDIGGVGGRDGSQAGHGSVHCGLRRVRELRDDRPSDGRHQRKHVRQK